MKWIAVNEQLPSLDVPVLIAYKDWDKMSICVAARGPTGYWNVQGASGYEMESDFQETDITHWMPPPVLPVVPQ